jgi:hydroxymethylpyrimidine pyrophosphatase-like HAD family hydrolase
MNITEIIKTLIGLGIGVFGLFAMAGTLLNHNKDDLQTTIVLFILTALMAGGGFWLVYSARQSSSNRKYKSLENKVLQAASLNGGRLSVAQLALQAHITTQEAEMWLNQMQERGHAHIAVNQEGAIIYEFTGLLK